MEVERACAEAAVQDRDLDHNGVTDAYSDTDLPKSAPQYAMLVRDGDVMAAVPEPETYALMLGGLAALAWTRRQQRR